MKENLNKIELSLEKEVKGNFPMGCLLQGQLSKKENLLTLKKNIQFSAASLGRNRREFPQ